jgi:hypothetical protein
MNDSSNSEIKNFTNQNEENFSQKEIFLKSNMTDEENETLKRLRKFRDLHNQVSEENRIPISHPDKYLVDD